MNSIMCIYRYVLILVVGLLFNLGCTTKNESNENESSENDSTLPYSQRVEIRKENGGFQLYRNNEPYAIKGAGVQIAFIDDLAVHGANSLRTWSTEDAQEMLDKAYEIGLTVSMGIWVSPERHHFDYDDEDAVKKQFEKIKKDILKFKDHPALLNWVIGNELNHDFHNHKVYDAVNEISKFIHKVDPNHLTTTTTSGINRELVDVIKSRAPDLDFLSIQVYAAIGTLPSDIEKSGWTGPYMVTEWGATGHWEVALTDWGAPIEQSSSMKAANYLQRYNTKIAPYMNQCIGYYVFLWGQKQERTPTWYGMFLEDGSATECVDAMHYVWNNAWPDNRTPKLDSMLLDGKNAYQNIRLKSDNTFSASVFITELDNDLVSYNWEVKSESDADQEGGDAEVIPETIHGVIDNPELQEIVLTAPSEEGAYRLFVYASDEYGHVAHANIPFYVEK